MWAMMQKFRMISGGVWPGRGAVMVRPLFHRGPRNPHSRLSTNSFVLAIVMPRQCSRVGFGGTAISSGLVSTSSSTGPSWANASRTARSTACGSVTRIPVIPTASATFARSGLARSVPYAGSPTRSISRGRRTAARPLPSPLEGVRKDVPVTSPRVPTTIPHGRTARRLEWQHLPPHVRALVEDRCGSPVVEARSQGAGFTPGFASVLPCADGSRHFVKAASRRAQRMFAEAYREEARKLGALPDDAPAPRLLWTHDADDWMVLGIEYVESRQPGRPWRAEDLDRCVAMAERMAAALTP